MVQWYVKFKKNLYQVYLIRVAVIILNFTYLSLLMHYLYFVVGHPDYVHIGEIVSKALSANNSNNTDIKTSLRNVPVVVIGQGNVALDCARVLAKGSTGLHDTDITTHSLSVLGDGVTNISVVGRRGHIQGAYTIKELRELVKLEQGGYETSFVVRNDELDMGSTSASQEELSGPLGRPKTRIDALLRDAASKGTSFVLEFHILF
jgi:adrenodoxin-NADP+ reductase